MPALDAASRSVGDAGVILGVNVQEDADRVDTFAAELGISYPIVLDPDAEVARLYRVIGFPTTYFIDAQGVIAEIFHGPLSAPLLETRLARLSTTAFDE
jgi:peroxiredoxin